MAGGRWSMREEVSLKPPVAGPPMAPKGTSLAVLVWFMPEQLCLGLQRGDLDVEEPAT